MALKGNLRDFTILQLLNLIHLARKTGTLVIEGAQETAQVAFREGKLAHARTGREDPTLAGVLYHSRKINRAQYHVLKTRAGNMGDKELGLLLVNAGYVTQEDVLVSLQQYATGVVRRMFRWADGAFRFDADQLPPDHTIFVKVDLENLIIEGTRHIQEWETLHQEIPNLDVALKFADRPGSNIRNVSLSVDEWRVVSFINPRNSIQQIARATKMNDLDVRRVVYSLLQAGLVEMIRTPNLVPPEVVNRAFPTPNKVEQKSLVNRLISRIRSL